MSRCLNDTGNWSYSEQHCPSIIDPSLMPRSKVFPVRLITVLFASLYITSAAWADIPAQAPTESEVTKSTTPAAPAVEAAAPATESPASATDTQSSTTAPAASPAKQEKTAAVDPVALKKAGYKVVNENGQTLYCRQDMSTGSHLKKTTTCLTERELEQLKDSTRREIEYMSKQNPPRQDRGKPMPPRN